MSILGSIRKNSWLLLVAIGMALLAFVINPSALKKLGLRNADAVAKVNGDKITLDQFNETTTLYNLTSGGRLNNRTIQNAAWNELVQQKLFNQQADELGIKSSPDNKQFWDEVQKILGSQAKQFEQNGAFNINLFQRQEALAKQQQNSRALSFFQWVRTRANKAVLENNYIGMIQKGLLITDKELNSAYENEYASANIQYIYIPYSTYPGIKDIRISDKQINAYVKKHKKKFDRPETRNLKYVILNVAPSARDRLKIRSELEKYLHDFTEKNPVTHRIDSVEGFKNTKNNKDFVQQYSEGEYSEGLVFDKDHFDKNVLTFAKKSSINEVYGPYETNGIMALSKLVARKRVSDSINISHILISYKGAAAKIPKVSLTKEQAKAKADSLLTIVKANPKNFGEIALKNSDFEQSSLRKGNLGWFRYNDILRQSVPFKDFVLSHKQGNIGLIDAPEGFQIIKIDEKKAPETGYQFANIVRKIVPSKETTDSIFNLSRKIAESFNGKDSAQVKKKADQFKVNLVNQVNLAQFKANPIDFTALSSSGNNEAAEQITKWAFNDDTKLKTAEAFDLTNGNYIIAYLTAKNPKGLIGARQARGQVEPILKNKAIAKKIIAAIGVNKDLDTIAKTTKQKIKTANNVSFSRPVISGIGSADVAIGTAFSQKVGTTSAPVKGKNGVFIIKTLSVNKAVENEKNKTTLKNQLKQTQGNRLIETVTDALKEISSVEDLRGTHPAFNR